MRAGDIHKRKPSFEVMHSSRKTFVLRWWRGATTDLPEWPKFHNELVFRHSHAIIALQMEDGTPFDYPALFYASPDDRWVVRIQKWASGENIACLYAVEGEGRVRRIEPPLDGAAWAFWEKATHQSTKSLYHRGVRFLRWDRRRQGFWFSLSAGDTTAHPQHVREFPLFYDLRTQGIRLR